MTTITRHHAREESTTEVEFENRGGLNIGYAP
jgi:hypothetical protein